MGEESEFTLPTAISAAIVGNFLEIEAQLTSLSAVLVRLLFDQRKLCLTLTILLLAFWNVPIIHAQSQTSKITKVLICSQVNGYGQYVQRSSIINLGETFYIYMEANIVGTVLGAMGERHLDAEFTLNITDPLGMATFSVSSTPITQYFGLGTGESIWAWWVPVNSSQFVNYINGNYQFQAGLLDFAANINTSTPGNFTLQEAFPGSVVFNVNDNVVLTNGRPSSSYPLQFLQVVEIPNISSYQTVLDGPRANIQPQGIAEDDYGNKYMLFNNMTIAPGANITLDVTYTVRIRLTNLIGNRTVQFSTLQNLPSEARKYLQPTQYIESDNPVFRGIANKFREKSTNVLQLINYLDNFTANYITYDNAALNDTNRLTQDSEDSALATYTKGTGVCTNYSRLLVALLRAAGIPARTVAGWAVENWLPGITYTDTIEHVWVELYLPGSGWVPVEPQNPATLGYTLGSYTLFDFSDSERNVNIEGYNGTILPLDYWSTSNANLTYNETFSHVATFSYSGNPSSKYETVSAMTVTNSEVITSELLNSTARSTSMLTVALSFLMLATPFIALIGVIVFFMRRRKRSSVTP